MRLIFHETDKILEENGLIHETFLCQREKINYTEDHGSWCIPLWSNIDNYENLSLVDAKINIISFSILQKESIKYFQNTCSQLATYDWRGKDIDFWKCSYGWAQLIDNEKNNKMQNNQFCLCSNNTPQNAVNIEK